MIKRWFAFAITPSVSLYCSSFTGKAAVVRYCPIPAFIEHISIVRLLLTFTTSSPFISPCQMLLPSRDEVLKANCKFFPHVWLVLFHPSFSRIEPCLLQITDHFQAVLFKPDRQQNVTANIHRAYSFTLCARFFLLLILCKAFSSMQQKPPGSLRYAIRYFNKLFWIVISFSSLCFVVNSVLFVQISQSLPPERFRLSLIPFCLPSVDLGKNV